MYTMENIMCSIKWGEFLNQRNIFTISTSRYNPANRTIISIYFRNSSNNESCI